MENIESNFAEGSSENTDAPLEMGLKSEDDKRPSKLAIMEETSNAPRGFGTRHWVTFMLFLGMANAYIMRTNMSVAIVAMVNHTALPKDPDVISNECGLPNATQNQGESEDRREGGYIWDTDLQGWILASFFTGYVITQVPFGVLSKRFGARLFLGVGMLINSVFGLLVPMAAEAGPGWLMVVRLVQGLGEGPIVPCTHAMLAKWVPPNERSRMSAAVYAGAQFGTIISMPLSGLLSRYGFSGGWPSIFYVFGAVGCVWSIAFLWLVYEDPEHCPGIREEEKKFIVSSLWGAAGSSSPPIPWRSILTSLPFWAIMLAHVGQNYGYETLLTKLPTYMHQILLFNIQDNGVLSALPYLSMWLFSMGGSIVADWMLSSGRLSHTHARKIMNSIGQYGPALGMVAVAHLGCDAAAAVAALTIGVGLNGAIYSGFKVNHLDISPRFAGVLMAFTNCSANLVGLLAPIVVSQLTKGRPTQAQWMKVFYIAAAMYILPATFYNVFGSAHRQPWDNPEEDESNARRAAEKKANKMEKKMAADGHHAETAQ